MFLSNAFIKISQLAFASDMFLETENPQHRVLSITEAKKEKKKPIDINCHSRTERECCCCSITYSRRCSTCPTTSSSWYVSLWKKTKWLLYKPITPHKYLNTVRSLYYSWLRGSQKRIAIKITVGSDVQFSKEDPHSLRLDLSHRHNSSRRWYIKKICRQIGHFLRQRMFFCGT